ncbi:MAG: AAC(3) family N-acetyltransferase [Bacteroidetes bacterium]|nr:AAC(3) family N-acetyltransferase [Bacteroidota bacterium]
MQKPIDKQANNDGKRKRELTQWSNEHRAKYANSTLICKINGESLTVEKLQQLCLRIGIRSGDVIFLHSSLVSLGNLEIEDSQKALSHLVRSFQEVVGSKGTVIMPTFTYSFLDESWSGPEEPYDVENSRSKTGALTDYFRQLPDVIRSCHPTHSVAIWGNNKKYFSDIDDSTFGTASIFGKIHSANAKIVGLGVPIPSTFIH